MDKAVTIFCLCAACFWAGVELSAALKPARTIYLLTKQPPAPAPKPAWWTADCNEVAWVCRTQRRMEKVKL